LVLIAPANSKLHVDLRTPGAIAKALGQGGRLAVGQTASVPAGKYAAAALRKLGQWDSVGNRLAESESVRAALMLVSRGEAPLGIVYGSDARADAKVRVIATFPDDSHDPIVYPVAALKNSNNPATAAFVSWLGSKPAKAIFARRGFSLKD
ncbi:molybdate ABC transporter substrate-binding protein, partial [Xanthomonas perforans]